MTEEKKESFICKCGHRFNYGHINLKDHTIFCPKCNIEMDVDPEIALIEYNYYIENKD